MNSRNHTCQKLRSLLVRWGYTALQQKDDGSTYISPEYQKIIDSNNADSFTDGETVFKIPSLESADSKWDSDLLSIILNLSRVKNIPYDFIKLIIEAEPIERDLGIIKVYPQPLDEFGDREDHSTASLVMDDRGRDRLLAALIEGRGFIEVYGESGGQYTLSLVRN